MFQNGRDPFTPPIQRGAEVPSLVTEAGFEPYTRTIHTLIGETDLPAARPDCEPLWDLPVLQPGIEMVREP